MIDKDLRMLHNISWSSYLLTILIVLVAYYTALCLKYYKAEINDILGGRYNIFSKTNLSNQNTLPAHHQKGLSNEQLNEHDLFPVINQFVDEIKYFLAQAALNNLINQEVLYSLQQLAKKYFQIKGSSFQAFITNYILVESLNYSSIHLSAEDLKTLWVM